MRSMLPTDHQKLTRERSGPIHRSADLSQMFAGFRVGSGFLQKTGVAIDDAQDVVEMMGHAAGKTARKLTLLTVTTFLFPFVALADVAGNHKPGGASGVMKILRRDFDVDNRFVFAAVLPYTSILGFRTRFGHVLKETGGHRGGGEILRGQGHELAFG